MAFSEKGYACLGCEDGSVQVFAGGKPAKSFANIHTARCCRWTTTPAA